MNPILTAILAIALTGADNGTAENPLLDSLLQKGVPLSDGSSLKLSPPTMACGLDAAGQQAVIARLATSNHPVDELMRKSIMAPFELAIRSLPSPGGKSPVRAVDLHFVAYGNWEAMKSRDFVDSLMSMAGSKQTGAQVPKAGFLSSEALAKRGIQFSPKPGLEEGAFFATVTMFDRVELQATRHVVVTRHADCVTIAAQIDPRFNADSECPNQWRSMKRDLDDAEKVSMGPPQTYAAAGFYGRITRLSQPQDAILVEYHVIFEEPEAWFQGANLLSSKLPLVIQDVVRSFRRKLLNPARD